MREQFEKLPEIAILLSDGEVYFDESQKKYLCIRQDDGGVERALGLALYAYQEQQKKIDFLNMKLEATKCVSSKRREEVLCRDSKINAAKKEINDFFDNQTMTPSPREYANKLADVLELLK